VRLAFVGCGRATTELHLPALRGNADIEVVAFCDVDAARAGAAMRLVPGARVVEDVATLARDPAIDAVAVCTPPSEHALQASVVLDAGKHLFVEKPLALTRSDCDAIVDRAASTSSVAAVGFNLRLHRLLQAAHKIIARGTLGRIDLVRSLFTTDTRLTRDLPGWRNDRALGGGVLFDLATHHFDLWRWLLSSEVVEVTALTRSDGSDDTSASVTAKLNSGALATAQMAERTTPVNQIDILGEHARMRVSLYDFDGLEVAPLSRLPGSLTTRTLSILRTLRALPAGVSGALKGGDYAQTYARQWRGFAASILRGRPGAATLDDGRAAVKIALAASASVAEGRPIQI
jgi:myo-inositol 2-dehydrogenase/D-chiro-inositol 1-dehydrogenase